MVVALKNSKSGAVANRRYRAAQLAFAACAARLALVLHAGFRPEQPRVPAGNADGGQWTKVPSSARRREESAQGNLHLVSGRPRGGGAGTYIAGRWQPLTANQQTRLALSQMEMDGAVRAVREILPNWKPQPQVYTTVEGLIGANLANAREARALRERWRDQGIGYSRFSTDSREARNSDRSFTREEREEINRIGRASGCHTCGTYDPGTRRGNFIPDHQLPTKLPRPPARQSLLPHCLSCSLRQGGSVSQIQRKR